MKGLLALLIVAVFVTSCLSTTYHVVPPIKSTGQEVGLIFIPGAMLNESNYWQVVTTIQKTSKLRMWVAFTGNYTGEVPNPGEVPGAIEKSMNALTQAGMKSRDFVGIGHSLGGVFLATYGEQKTPLKAIVLMGSYINRKINLKDYATPVLTLSGELDGQARITRIALNFEQLQNELKTSPDALYRTPVINIKGSNHGQFAAGYLPPIVQKYDIDAEITIEEAHIQIGIHCDNFITANVGTRSGDVVKAKLGLKEAHKNSTYRFEPLLKMKALDIQGSLSPWALEAQAIFAGSWISNITINDVLLNSPEFLASKPSLTKTVDRLTVNTSSRVEYKMNPFDLSTIQESPFEIDVKMKSRDAIAKALKNNTVISDKTPTCLQTNKAALQLALKHSTPESRKRYTKHNRPMTFLNDVIYSTGIQWVSASFQLTETDEGLKVQSPVLLTSTSSWIFPGMHYCKLLSPYRAMEWIHVDSLRNKAP